MISIEQLIGYEFKDKTVLYTALTHTSYAYEKNLNQSNERMEFLGDSILGFICANELFRRYPEKTEGELTRLRAAYVRETNLSRAARLIGLGDAMRFGRGEESGGGRERDSVLADAFEALIAAVFLDGGIEAAKAFVETAILGSEPVSDVEDAKSLLQETVQKHRKCDVSYRLISETGPDHQKIFVSEVVVGGEVLGRGEGRSKKASEQSAAKSALKRL